MLTTIQRLRRDLKNEREALQNVIRQNAEQVKWIRWADKELTRLRKKQEAPR